MEYIKEMFAQFFLSIFRDGNKKQNYFSYGKINLYVENN